MILTNNEIYTYARKLAEAFNDTEQKLPIKISFYLQKNKTTLLELAQDIEKARMEIAQKYGELDEVGTQYIIPAEAVETAGQELDDLLNLEQEVQIYTINIDTLNMDLAITNGQMEALMFMIEQ